MSGPLLRLCYTVHMFTAVYKKEPRGYAAWIEEIPGVNTQGRTRAEARENLEDALHEFVLAQRMFTKRARGRGTTLVREKLGAF